MSVQLPPTIQGDGRTFIASLKKYLSSIDHALASVGIGDGVTGHVHTINTTELIRNTTSGLRSDILVDWSTLGVRNYGSANVYIKFTQGSFVEMNESMEDFDSFDEIPTGWRSCGNGYKNFTITDVTLDSIVEIKVVAVSIGGVETDFDSAPSVFHTVGGSLHRPTPPITLSVTFDRNGCTWYWDKVNDANVIFYELRLDDNPGAEINLLDRQSVYNQSKKVPPTRVGTAYLYTASINTLYTDQPIIKPFNKPVPEAPTDISTTRVYQGFRVDFSNIPDDCLGANVYINGEKFFTQNNYFDYTAVLGTFTISVAFVDSFGEGIRSESVETSVIELVDQQMLADESISLEKVDAVLADAIARAQTAIDTDSFNEAISERVSYTDFNSQVNTLVQADSANASAIQQTNNSLTTTVAKLNSTPGSTGQFTAISQLNQKADEISSTVTSNKTTQDGTNQSLQSQITQTAGSVTSVVTELNKTTPSYTSFTQINNAINLKATKANLISQINVCPEVITIDGSKVHITGDTTFDNGVIVSAYIGDQQVVGTKIKDGEISTQKLGANSITAAKINTTEINANSAFVDVLNGRIIKTGTLNADRITANTIDSTHLKSGSVTGDKIVANISLSSPIINGGTITGTTINGGTIIGGRIQNANNSAYIDSNGNIHGVNISSSTIDANSIESAGYKIRSVIMVKGTIANGGTIPLPTGYTHDQCVFAVVPIDDTTNPTVFAGVDYTTRIVMCGYDYLVSTLGVSGNETVGYWLTGSVYLRRKYQGLCNYWIMGVK